MWKSYKYDVVFSFVEADRKCVQEIADKLKGTWVKYYLYDEHQASQWGANIFTITLEIYRKSRYVVMVTSKDFIHGRWARIETEVVIAHRNELSGRVLQLKIDKTPISGLTDSVTYVDWNDDAGYVANMLISKVRQEKRREIIKRLTALAITGLIASTGIFLYTAFITPKIPGIDRHKSVPIKIEPSFNPSNTDSMILGTSLSPFKESFYLNSVETTVSEYAAYCDSVKKPMPPQPTPVLDNNPVVNVSWEEALAYCKWKGGRLPSESEWKQAASAGLDTKYSGGNNAGKVAVYHRKHLSLIGSKDPNALGLYDMSGNAAEWCNTSFDSSDKWKVVKGGSYKDGIEALLISSKSKEQMNAKSPYIGFRIAWDQIPTK